MHYRQLCGKPYLAAANLQEGKEYPCEIEEADREMAYNPKKRRDEEVGFLKFKDKELKLILNITNGDIIASMYGDQTSGWGGEVDHSVSDNNKVRW